MCILEIMPSSVHIHWGLEEFGECISKLVYGVHFQFKKLCNLFQVFYIHPFNINDKHIRKYIIKI